MEHVYFKRCISTVAKRNFSLGDADYLNIQDNYMPGNKSFTI